jgi:hypothetical protein
MTRIKDKKTIAVQRSENTVETLYSYSYNDFIKLKNIIAVFQQKEELDWAYANRMQLSCLTAEDLYEKSPFLDYADDINNPLHIRFASIRPSKLKSKGEKMKKRSPEGVPLFKC